MKLESFDGTPVARGVITGIVLFIVLAKQKLISWLQRSSGSFSGWVEMEYHEPENILGDH